MQHQQTQMKDMFAANISSDYAKELGSALPRGAKKEIAQQLKYNHYYVRYILTGNGGKNLTTPMQIEIINKAIEMLNSDINYKIEQLTNKRSLLLCQK